MAEDVVEIAGDAFAFGDGGEGYVLLLGEAEFAVGAFLLSKEDVAATDDEEEEDADDGVRPSDVEWARRLEEGGFAEDA